MTVRAIVGCAGGGKTHHLMEALRNDMDGALLNPDKTAVISFTNASANDLAAHVSAADCVVGTVHSLGRKLALLCDNAEQMPVCKSPAAKALRMRYTLDDRFEVMLLLAAMYHYGVEADKSESIVASIVGAQQITNKVRLSAVHYANSLKYRESILLSEMITTPIAGLVAGLLDTDWSVYVDEAQDLSPFAWAFLDRLSQDGRLVFAGDDRQSIYGHLGINSIDFTRRVNALPSDCITRITNSKRVPECVADRARQWFKDDYPFTGHNGSGEFKCVRVRDIPWNDMLAGDNMLLCRTNRELADYESILINRCIPYQRLGKNNKTCGIHDVDYQQVQKLPIVDHEAILGLLTDSKHTFKQPDVVAKQLMRLYDKRGCFPNPAVRTGTMHASKGLEADTVFTIHGQSNICNLSDDERRIYFVALTRSKRLHYAVIAHNTAVVTP